MHFSWLTPPGPYRTTACREMELTLDTYIFDHIWTWRASPDDQLNAGTTSETTRTLKTIHTVHSLIHSKADMIRMIMVVKWYSRNDGDLQFPDICLTREETPPQKKKSPRKLVPTGDRTLARCVTGIHATACTTAVDRCTLLTNSAYMVHEVVYHKFRIWVWVLKIKLLSSSSYNWIPTKALWYSTTNHIQWYQNYIKLILFHHLLN